MIALHREEEEKVCGFLYCEWARARERANARTAPRDGSRVLVLACARGQRKSRITHLIIARFSVGNAFPLIILIFDLVLFRLH